MTTALELDTYRRTAERDLLPLLQALHAVLAQGKPAPQNLLNALALTAAQQAEVPAAEAFGETLASLVRVRTLPQQAQAVALKLSVPRGALLAQRAAEVLLGRSEAYVDPYTRLAAQVLIFDSHREGASEGGRQGGATHKQFIRVRPVAEPRSHSIYEGTVRELNGTWLIAGIEAQGPGDERLPWSEKAFCGHVTRYFRR